MPAQPDLLHPVQPCLHVPPRSHLERLSDAGFIIEQPLDTFTFKHESMQESAIFNLYILTGIDRFDIYIYVNRNRPVWSLLDLEDVDEPPGRSLLVLAEPRL